MYKEAAAEPCQCNSRPKDNDGRIAQHIDHRWNSALHEEA